MLAEDIVDYLSSGGLGTAGTDLFAGFLPDTPEVCGAVYETGGTSPVRAMSGLPGTAPFERPRIQVVFRATQYDYATARLKAHNAFMLLDGLPKRTINGTQYYWGEAVQSPFVMNRDGNGLVKIACNFDIVKALSTA